MSIGLNNGDKKEIPAQDAGMLFTNFSRTKMTRNTRQKSIKFQRLP